MIKRHGSSDPCLFSLGERRVRNAEVDGSILFVSTKFRKIR